MKKLVAGGIQPVHHTCMEDDQIFFRSLGQDLCCLLCAYRRLSEEWVVLGSANIHTSLSHTDSFTYFIQLCSLLTVHGCLFLTLWHTNFFAN
jgi:hypothetical protein